MELKLKVLSGKQAGVEIAIAGPRFTIGRGDDNHLRPHSDAISRHHCEVLIDGGAATVRDLGSRNGTFVNGQRISEQQRLKAGDKLTVGQLQFEVHLVPELGGPKRPKVLDAQDAAKRMKSESSAATHDDVASWLSESGPPPAVQDTQQLSAADTGQFARSDSGTPAGIAETASSSDAEAARGEETTKEASADTAKGPKPMGKLPSPPQAPDSRAAAAEFLKKMAKYR
jgi:pSer/pThr/pTyr-binding forkhead associated (FHA) protein